MASQKASRTSQKLYFAKILLEGLPDVKQPNSMNAAAIDQAFVEAVCFHLFGAYQSLLREIIESYHMSIDQLDTTPIRTAQSVQAYCQQQGRMVPELNRLISLEEDANSWLAQLVSLYGNAIDTGANRSNASSATTANNAISMRSSDLDKIALLNEIHQQLPRLADDLRQSMEEW